MRVFISHSSQDKAQVEALAVALREPGFRGQPCGRDRLAE